MAEKPRLLRITTVPISLKLLLRGQLSFMRSHGFDVLAVSADGPETDAVREEGIAHVVVPMTRRISPLHDLVSLFRLIAVVRRFRPDIVHTHTPKAGLLGMLAAWICRVPVRLHTVAGLPLMERKGVVRRILMLTEKLTYACATAVYPNAEGLKTFIKGNIHTRTPIRLIGRGSSNGVDTVFFAPSAELLGQAATFREKHGIPPGNVVFCFIGRIVRDKGVDELLEVFDALSAEIPCTLLLAGHFEDDLDPISAKSRETIARNSSVIKLGYVHDVRPLLLACDVFVLPSYREGFPNVVMQACCMNRACIVTDINGSNEIIAPEITGLVVPPKDVAALRAAMRRLAMNPGLRKKLGEASGSFVRKNFDQAFVWDQLLAEYRRLFRADGKG